MINIEKLRRDLALDIAYTPDRCAPQVHNCYHFSSDGNATDELFLDTTDFKDGMNRVAILSLRFNILILAFVLMDTHIHFVLYGAFEECQAFVHEFMRLTGMSLSFRHGEKAKTHAIPIDYKVIHDADYLRNAICYDFRNPTVAGIKYMFYDYPWSSGPTMFRSEKGWARAMWTLTEDRNCPQEILDYFKIKRAWELGDQKETRQILKSHDVLPDDWILIDGVIFPGCYIPLDIVTSIFRSHKSFLFFCGRNNEKEMDKDSGQLSRLSLPNDEMKQHRDEIIAEKFGDRTIRSLNAEERMEVARTLRSRYRASIKQIANIVRMPVEMVEKWK